MSPLTPRAPAWVQLAAGALHAARLGDWTRANSLVGRLARTHGYEEIPQVILAWIDTLADAIGVDDYGPGVALSFERATDGKVSAAGGVPDSVAWAGRLIAARLADDQPTFEALLAAVPDDATWSRNVRAVLETIALTMNRYATPLRRP